ncbi:MAG: hypothetical protein IT258_13860 [Saprospiraceae bacterium]|nr:hypothetical protein [Saprospiraceae bacterium]
MAAITKFDNFQALKLVAEKGSDKPISTNTSYGEFEDFMALLRKNFIDKVSAQKPNSKKHQENGEQLGKKHP